MTVGSLDELVGTLPRPPVLVLGSGPAGTTVARELAAAGIASMVAESGDRLPGAAAMDLDRGDVVGLPLRFEDADIGTTGMRMRALGGASGHWTGMCHPLEALDFAPRPWRPGSGWPIDREELEPFYRQAEATLALRPGAWDPAAWHAAAGTTAPIAGGRLDAVAFQFSTPVRFAEAFGPELEASELVDVRLDATATGLSTTRDGSRVTAVVLRSRSGVEVLVRPELVVVATGAMEVPRLLLASQLMEPAGVANRSGLVGVGFMDHPHRWVGRAHLVEDPVWSLYRLAPPPDASPPSHVWLGWRPTDEVQEAERLGNAAVFAWPGGGRGAAAADPSAEAVAAGLLLGGLRSTGTFEASLSLRCEQLPLPTSTVRLATDVDAVGLPRLVVDWQVDDDVERTMRRTLELLAGELGRAGLGRVEVDPGGEPLDELPVEIGCHPMGTARMGEDPSTSVVDAQLRAHDVENLYVAGSAVFRTGGHANPTLTVVALAHRLGAHLAAELA